MMKTQRCAISATSCHVQKCCFESFHRRRRADGIVLSDGFDDALTQNRLLKNTSRRDRYRTVSDCDWMFRDPRSDVVIRVIATKVTEDCSEPFALRLVVVVPGCSRNCDSNAGQRDDIRIALRRIEETTVRAFDGSAPICGMMRQVAAGANLLEPHRCKIEMARSVNSGPFHADVHPVCACLSSQ